MKLFETQFEDFLAEIGATLSALPEERRQEILLETRGHLEAMIAARRADGFDEVAAWESAHRDFGDARDIGGDVLKEWKRVPRYETEGEPLSKQYKRGQVARILMLVIPTYSVFLVSMSHLMTRNLDQTVILILTLCTFVFQIWRFRKNGTKFTPTTIAALAFWFIIFLVYTLRIQFDEQLYGTPFGKYFDLWFSPIMAVVGIMISLWMRRDARKTFPWRHSPRFAQNPVAAEDRYHFSYTLGLIMGTAMGCIGSLWMGWQFFGLAAGSVLCLFQILFALVFDRWIIKRSI